ncbi:MerR family transcriptional regulator [Umezawaea endophytica]|uniref:MerR family transcriptional regulator n=1 Tax=Umezawaea endophytica TaxID=1654476 RepID=A0A9X2VW96_9PSEU|nr:MerR family transcriptional regulator [Umezawaea endophytica]MCS7484008.1 MerR family transcriptional regulator [Umezawaea endophytica]
MRIGELAALAGVTTRAVRHYHRRGLLPEPPRRANGYRVYGLRDALVLARVRRLSELGLSLDEVRDVLADGTGRDFHEILLELDDDLTRQETRIRDRRARLAALLRGVPTGEDPLSADLAALLEAIGHQPGSTAAKERELLALLDTSPDRDRVLAVLRPLADDPAAVERGSALNRELDALVDAEVDDPRVGPLAAALAESLPAGLVSGEVEGGSFGEAVLESMAPAQAEVVRRALRLVARR